MFDPDELFEDEPVPRETRERFFADLAENGDEYGAAARLGIGTLVLKELRHVRVDNWVEAELEAEDALIAEGRRRALEVRQVPLVSRGRPVLKADGTVLTLPRYSDGVMIRMLELIEADA